MVDKQIIIDFIAKQKLKNNKFIFQLLNNAQPNPVSFKMKFETKCLVLSPCIGVESMALGGLIAKSPKNFEVLSLTKSSDDKKNELFERTMNTLRVKGYKLFDIVQNNLKNEYKKISKIDISEMDYIFVPNPFELDEDSKALLSHLKNILKTKEHKKKIEILMYETTTPIPYIDYYCDITSIATTKSKILESYAKSPTEGERIARAILGLNNFRALNLNLNYVEGFMRFSVEDFYKLDII